MTVTYELAKCRLRDYSCKYSHKDFISPQLFARLVVWKNQNRSYRGVEALLRPREKPASKTDNTKLRQ
jgi:hypothetical protein